MKTGDIIKINITDIAEDGKGIGRAGGLAAFVRADISKGIRSLVPGDVVQAAVTKVKKRFVFADAVAVLDAGDCRTARDCPYFGRCGGCALREMEYGAQLALKRSQIVSKLERIAGLTGPAVGEVIPGDHFRNKATFAVMMTAKGPVVGFRERGSNRVIDITECQAQHYSVMAAANAVRELIRKGLITAIGSGDPAGRKTGLREFTVKLCEGTGEMMVVLTMNSRKLPNEEAVVYALDDAIYGSTVPEFGAEENRDADCIAPFLASVVVEYKPAADINEPAKDYVTVAGSGTVTDALRFDHAGGREMRFEISAPAFYQTNTEQMKRLYAKAAEYAGLSGSELLLDLYCGIGTIGLSMADKCRMVLGVETVKGAVIDANRNAVINGIVNALYFTGKAEEVLPRIFDPEDDIYNGRIDDAVAILDPPRAGCDERLIRAIADEGVPKIVYISCDAGTLARDIKLFTELGYTFAEATPVDMFPYTTHTETVCLLGRRKPDDTIKVSVNMDDYYQIRDAEEAEKNPS